MDKSLFKRAIEDTPDATPGYMFRDIAQWTFVDQNTQTKLVTALFDKLNPKTSVHVLAKVLRIIKIVCETGHSDFQKEMQRRSDQIKDYASYRGAPHPQFGDRLNEKVRIAAKDAIEAAFTARKENKIQVEAGHGSEPAKTSSSSSASGVVGGVFGSLGFSSFTTGHQISASQAGDTRVAAMPTTNKWAEHMARAGAEPSAPMAVVSNVVDKAKLGFGLFGNEQIKSKEDRMWSAQSDVGEFKAVDIAFVGGSRGPFGPNATSASSSSAAAGGGGDNGAGWKFADEAEAGLPPIEQHATIGGRFLTPYQREVERIATMKNAPQRVDLTQFLAAVKDIHDNQGMAYEDLAQTLDEYIGQKHSWQSRLNVMILIEALLKAELSPEIGAYFNENPEDVQRNVHVVQSSLKEKSQKVLKLLGIPERTSATSATTTSSVPPTTTVGGTGSTNNTNDGDLDFDSLTVTRKSRRANKASSGGGFTSTGEEEPSSKQQQQQQVFSNNTSHNNSVGGGGDLDSFLGSKAASSSTTSSSADPTKLRKRAQITNVEAYSAPAAATAMPPSAPAAATTNGWGSTTAGWGSSAEGTASGGWGSSMGGGGGWGETATTSAASPPSSSSGWGAPVTNGLGTAPSQQTYAAPLPQQQQQQQQAPAAVTNRAAVDFDELFSSTSPSPQSQQQRSNEHHASPSSSAAAAYIPAPTVATATTATAIALTPAQQAADQQMTMVLQMQQQVQAMLAKINMNDPSALPQMQMLMQQQQQLMTMMQQAQQAQAAANEAAASASSSHHRVGIANNASSPSANSSISCNSPVQPHGHFDAPPLVKDHTKEKAFADVQNEMVQMLMSQK